MLFTWFQAEQKNKKKITQNCNRRWGWVQRQGCPYGWLALPGFASAAESTGTLVWWSSRKGLRNGFFCWGCLLLLLFIASLTWSAELWGLSKCTARAKCSNPAQTAEKGNVEQALDSKKKINKLMLVFCLQIYLAFRLGVGMISGGKPELAAP